MQTEALFEKIAERIHSEIIQAKSSVLIAVAWFTHKTLFNTLLQKAMEGCSVSLIISNDSINDNATNNFNLLNTQNSHVYKMGDGDKNLMHNKFCVIDNRTVITGSYNWSYKAESNYENIVITYDDFSLAEQFAQEFHNIRVKYYPHENATETVLPLSKVIKRLEIIKNYIVLEDFDELKREVQKMKAFSFNSFIAEIIYDIECQSYASAVSLIQDFITKHIQLTLWNDPEISALKLEINILENQLNAFTNERVELEKTLSEFGHKHFSILGDLITEILRLRKIKNKDDKEKFEDAEKDEKDYNEQFKIEKEKIVFELTDGEKKDLKKKWRQASFLCHPDKFANEDPEVQLQAEAVSKELNEAYEKNDLKRVSDILENLKNGNLNFTKSAQISDKEKLKATVSNLRQKISELQIVISEIRESETYKTIENIRDWDEFFNNQKDVLEKELNSLRKEIGK